MFIPLGTDRPLRRKPVVTPVLLVANAAVYLVLGVLQSFDESAVERVYAFGHVWGHDFRWHTLLTSAFLHIGLMHILGNMLFLWVFGPPVEDRLGRIGFTVFYLGGAAASGGLHAAFSDNPAVGASGAIAAVAGAFLVLFPRTTIRLFVLLIIIGIFNVPAWWFIGLKIAMDLFAQGFGADNGVANLAHLGGYAFGIAVAMGLLATGLLQREPMYDLFSLAAHSNRRRAIRQASQHYQHRTDRVASHADRQPPAPPVNEALAEARAEVSRLVSAGDLGDALEAYARLLNEFAHEPSAGSLSRNALYALANHAVGAGEHRLAAQAYARFLDAYPADREASDVALMLARLKGRHLGERAEAIQLLERLMDTLEGPTREIASEELALLRERPPEGVDA